MKKLLVSLLMFGLSASAEFMVPATPYPVNDYAKVLSLDGKELIAKKLVQLKTETGVQLGVLIVDTLDGTSIEEAAIKVVESWKLGSKNADDGALLMLSIKEHKSRLEIGKGVQGFLTDANASRILYDMKPYLRSGDYVGALSGAVDTVAASVAKNKADIMRKPVTDGEGIPGVFLFVIGVLGLVLFSVCYSVYSDNKKNKERQRLLDLQKKLDDTKKGSWESYLLLKQMHTKTTPGGTTVNPKKLKKFNGTPVAAKHVSDDNSFVKGVVAGAILDEVSHSSSSSSYDSGSSSSSSSDYSSSSSDFSGGGGSFDGGGSSGSW